MRTKEENEKRFADRSLLDGFRSFFMIGIGGAGMSAVALMLKRRGFRVRGTDAVQSETTDMLRAMGIEVSINHGSLEPEMQDAVVVSDAIDLTTNPDVLSALEINCPLFRRSQVLGWLLRGKRVIAVTGTHGKTTVTGMIGSGLLEAYVDPTIVVGAEVPEFGGAVIEGDGDWAVVEACEAYDGFHDIDPHIVVLTNLESDHLDFHGSYENLANSALSFIARIPEDGALIYCATDNGACELAKKVQSRKVGYDSTAFYKIANDAITDESPVPEINLAGEHNRLNASAALLATLETHASAFLSARGIARFRGANRRLQLIRSGDITVVDDYAHHPTEIRASISALREKFPAKRLIVVFQPHLYTRTAEYLTEFAKALDAADYVVLTDIYPARELAIPGISSALIAERMSKTPLYVPQRRLLAREVAKIAKPGDVIVGMGAGSISEFALEFVEEIETVRDRILVVFGGDSAEREVSLLSGRAIETALRTKGHPTELVDISELLASGADLTSYTGPARPLAAFLAVHGTHAEDGAIQGFFEMLHIPYTGSDIRSSAIAMDKHLSKTLLSQHGIKCPIGEVVNGSNYEDFVKNAFEGPYVVKPNAQGSTIGLTFVDDPKQLFPAITKALNYDREVIIEQRIIGTEISVPVIERNGLQEALPAVEIVPASGNYDFAAKYTEGMTEERIPAGLSAELEARARETAVKAHQVLKCRGATRTDMIVRANELYVLEVNTIPGMTSTSLLPNSARAAGIEFDELCILILEEALHRDA